MNWSLMYGTKGATLSARC